MKKWFTLFGAALLAFAIVSCGEAKAKKTKIGVSIPAADHGWDLQRREREEEARGRESRFRDHHLDRP